MKQVLQLFREATISTMALSGTLASAVSGGVLLSPLTQVPTVGECSAITARYPDSTLINGMVSQFAVFWIINQ